MYLIRASVGALLSFIFAYPPEDLKPKEGKYLVRIFAKAPLLFVCPLSHASEKIGSEIERKGCAVLSVLPDTWYTSRV